MVNVRINLLIWWNFKNMIKNKNSVYAFYFYGNVLVRKKVAGFELQVNLVSQLKMQNRRSKIIQK